MNWARAEPSKAKQAAGAGARQAGTSGARTAGATHRCRVLSNRDREPPTPPPAPLRRRTCGGAKQQASAALDAPPVQPVPWGERARGRRNGWQRPHLRRGTCLRPGSCLPCIRTRPKHLRRPHTPRPSTPEPGAGKRGGAYRSARRAGGPGEEQGARSGTFKRRGLPSSAGLPLQLQSLGCAAEPTTHARGH